MQFHNEFFEHDDVSSVNVDHFDGDDNNKDQLVQHEFADHHRR